MKPRDMPHRETILEMPCRASPPLAFGGMAAGAAVLQGCVRWFRWVFTALMLAAAGVQAASGRLYAVGAPGDTGAIRGRLATGEVRLAVAVDSSREKVFRAEVAPQGAFCFERLSVGRFSLAIVTRDGALVEGIPLGDEAAFRALDGTSAANLRKRVVEADSFFNRHAIHRAGIEGDRALVLVERIRDKLILKGSGEKLPANLRRLEVVELARATDDWELMSSRSFYREEEPQIPGMPFLAHRHEPSLGGIRVVDSAVEIGTIPPLPAQP